MDNTNLPPPGEQSSFGDNTVPGGQAWRPPTGPIPQPSGPIYPPPPPTGPIYPTSQPSGPIYPTPQPSGAFPPPSGPIVPPPGAYPPPGPPGYPPQGGVPRRQNALTRKVALPIWFVIILVICAIGGFGTAVAHTSSNTPNTNNQQASTAPTATPTATPTFGPSPTPSPTNTPRPTATPTHAPQWTAIQTFQGNGNKKTETFSVPNDWRISWSCDPSSFGGSYNVIVDVYNSDGSDFDLGAINTICQSGNTSNETEEHQSGTVYLDIQSEAVWTIQIEVLK